MASKYTKSAKGQDCEIMIPGICNHNPETTIFAHLSGGGMGMKTNDIHGAYACSSCHDAIDGRTKTEFTYYNLKFYHYEGMVRTQEIMINKGILKL